MLQTRFHREVSILKACRNKNIVSFLGQFTHDQKTWLIMEYMEVCYAHCSEKVNSNLTPASSPFDCSPFEVIGPIAKPQLQCRMPCSSAFSDHNRMPCINA